MVTKEFLTAGNATFTVELPAAFIEANATAKTPEIYHPHYTYKIERTEFKRDAKTFWFIYSLTGPDNTADYTYLGKVNPETGEVSLTAKSAFPATATRVKVAQRVVLAIFAGNGAKVEAAGWKVHHEGRCGRCARVLTVPDSIESGIGPECAKKMGCSKPVKKEAFPAPTAVKVSEPTVKMGEAPAKTESAVTGKIEQKKAKPGSYPKPVANPLAATGAPLSAPVPKTYPKTRVVYVSDEPYIDVSKLNETRDTEGELQGWWGELNGQPVVVLND